VGETVEEVAAGRRRQCDLILEIRDHWRVGDSGPIANGQIRSLLQVQVRGPGRPGKDDPVAGQLNAQSGLRDAEPEDRAEAIRAAVDRRAIETAIGSLHQ